MSLASRWQWAQSHKARLLLYNDVGYPEALNSIYHLPPLLWVQGRISLLNEPSIAMVKTHKASASGMALNKHFASSLGASGLTIVSGLALGLDGSCHQGALNVQADTIAALGSGLGQTSVLSTRHYRRWRATGLTLAPHGKTPWLQVSRSQSNDKRAQSGCVSGRSSPSQ